MPPKRRGYDSPDERRAGNGPPVSFRALLPNSGAVILNSTNPDRPNDEKLIKIKGGETTDLGELKIIKED
jgi:hypothetical protein